MIRGTTPTLTFTLPFEVNDIALGYVTIQQNGKTVIDREFAECITNDKTVCLKLTQKDTLALNVLHQCKIQIRVKMLDGTAMASNVFTASVGQILKDGEI